MKYYSRIALFIFLLTTSSVFARSLPVKCEYPVFKKLDHSARLHEQKIGIIKGKIQDQHFIVEDEHYDALSQTCVHGEQSKFDSNYVSNPSLVATYSDIATKSFHPVVAKSTLDNYKKYIEEMSENAPIRDPGNTLTFFFHGTGSNPSDLTKTKTFPSYDQFDQDSGGELMSHLAKRYRQENARENIDFVSLPGPGSDNRFITSLHKKFLISDSYSNISGNALGSGTSENIQHAMMHLQGITENPANMPFMIENGEKLRSVGRVLVTGWSRGAVTAIEFAAKLFKNPELKDVEVYLFLVDPVPGLGNYGLGLWPDINLLYPNVKKSFIHYARNEFSFGFTPIVPSEADEEGKLLDKNINRKIMFWPGNHATLVGNILDSKKSNAQSDFDLAGTARIIRGLAELFLIKFGAPLEAPNYYAKSSTPNIKFHILKDFKNLIQPSVQEKFSKMNKESYTWKTQIFSGLRKMSVAWYTMSTYTEKNIPGFSYFKDFENEDPKKKRIYVNKLHRLLHNLLRENRNATDEEVLSLLD